MTSQNAEMPDFWIQSFEAELQSEHRPLLGCMNGAQNLQYVETYGHIADGGETFLAICSNLQTSNVKIGS